MVSRGWPATTWSPVCDVDRDDDAGHRGTHLGVGGPVAAGTGRELLGQPLEAAAEAHLVDAPRDAHPRQRTGGGDPDRVHDAVDLELGGSGRSGAGGRAAAGPRPG